jgi:putative ABC transport system permease protein
MNLSLSLKLLWRDWRSGELNLLLASLIIAVATVTTITLFVDRLQQALVQESSSFLAADRVIEYDQPLDPEILDKARELGLQDAETLSFLSMVFSEDRAQFASVKAVSDNYPLRGDLIVSDRAFERGEVIRRGPPVGELWLESRLLPSLDLNPGEYLDVGVASFKVSKALIKEPDRGGGFNSAGPRVMMNIKDVSATEVVQPGSRITYRYLFAAEREALESFETWVKPRLPKGSRIFGVKEGAEAIGSALEKAERFLLLGALLGVILAGVAIALSAQRYSLRHYDHIAILKTLGARPLDIDSLFFTIFFLLGIFATFVGSGLGYLSQLGVVYILDSYLPIHLPPAGMEPIILGLVTGFVCLFSFALPPLIKLRATEPVRVIRRDIEEGGVSVLIAYAFGVLGTFSLMWWYSQDLKLTLMLFGGGVVAILSLSVVAFALLRSGSVLGMQAGSVWRLALAGMQRRGKENTMQILVFGLAIMLLLILFLIRTALIDDWQSQIPEDAPNHFAINISPEDVAPIRQLLADTKVPVQPIFPMIRGRVVEINKTAEANDNQTSETENPEDAPPSGNTRNLTYAINLPKDNQIVDGQWWEPDYKGEVLVSVEQEFAVVNNIVVEDELIFEIQGRQLSAKVSNIRSVNWDNMQPNFYIILSPGALIDFPSTFMTSFFLPADQKVFLNELLRAYPTMTVIEVDAVIRQIKTIITQVTLAIELVLILILVSGALVLLASIQASMDERFKQHAILRTLGASQKLIMGSLVIEFCALGLFAGILATVGAELTVFGLKEEIFDLPYTINFELWLIGPVLGMVLIGTLGTLATKSVVRTPPIIVLRNVN